MLWGKATSFQVSRCPCYVWTVARGSAAEELRGEPQGCRVHGTPQKGGVPAWGCPWRGLWQPSSTRTVTDSLPTFCCESSSYWWTLFQKYQTRRCKPEYLTWSGEPAAPVPAGWQREDAVPGGVVPQHLARLPKPMSVPSVAGLTNFDVLDLWSLKRKKSETMVSVLSKAFRTIQHPTDFALLLRN